MARVPADDQLDLFPGLTAAKSTPSLRPWRAALADEWRHGEVDPESLERGRLEPCLSDLLVRDRQLLKALKLAGVPEDAPDVERFRQQEAPLIRSLLELRLGSPPEAGSAEIVRDALETVDALAEIRRQILEGLEPEQRECALKAEPRTRVTEFELHQELAPAELALAEERGQVVEIVLSREEGEGLPPGFFGPADVEAMAQHALKVWKDEQDRRPLPRQLRLKTLLKGIPTIWLDPVCGALGIDPGSLTHRKDREMAVARILGDPAELRKIVRDKLSAGEQELAAYLLERGGQAASSLVARRFGSDDEDGWFWNEKPPTSVLGRLRLHGLAFVGCFPVQSRMVRSVAIPRELREGLAAALESCAESASAEASSPHRDSDLRGDVAEAIDLTFPDGMVDMPIDVELSYFTDVYPQVRARLKRIQNASLAFERDPDGGPGWNVGWVDEESYDDLSYSYYLFFLSSRGLDFGTEDELPDEGDVLQRVPGTGQVGYSVGVSLVAPYACVARQTMEQYEDGGYTVPDLEDADVGGLSEERCRELAGEDGIRALDALRQEIVAILGASGIAVLPAGELVKIVPGLAAGEEAFVGDGLDGSNLTVRDAFFFHGP